MKFLLLLGALLSAALAYIIVGITREKSLMTVVREKEFIKGRKCVFSETECRLPQSWQKQR